MTDRQQVVEAIEGSLARVAALEPSVHALVGEDAREQRIAAAIDELFTRFPDPDQRPPLFGTLVGVKDIFHVDGLPTQAGSRLPADRLTGEEATSVAQLRAAGAIVLAKTVTTEFAYFGPGPTRNPHHLEHTPGGSSSGSAAAVAASYCPLALGTQTIGSVNRPAAFCGVYGFKPSHERISRAGVIPLSTSLDHIGLFARRLETLRVGAEALLQGTGFESEPPTDDKPALAVPIGAYLEGTSPEGLAHFQSTVDQLVAAGFDVQRVAALHDIVEVEERHGVLVANDAAATHAEWYADYADLYHPKTRELIERGQSVSSEACKRAQADRDDLRDTLESQAEEHRIDLWLTPSAPGAAPHGIGSTGDPKMNLPWTQAGLPTLTIPTGVGREKLPLGLQIVGRWQRDEEMFGLARMIDEVVAELPIPHGAHSIASVTTSGTGAS